jgi:type VI secretion system protein
LLVIGMRPSWRRVRIALALALAITPSACLFRRGPIQTREMQVVAGSTANDNSPTSVETVMVYDPVLLKSLLTMTAADWFATRDQLRNDYPGGFDSRAWEVVPGQQIDLRPLPFRRGLALLVYANYHTPGPHRARIDAWKNARVLLRDKDFTVVDVR